MHMVSGPSWMLQIALQLVERFIGCMIMSIEGFQCIELYFIFLKIYYLRDLF